MVIDVPCLFTPIPGRSTVEINGPGAGSGKQQRVDRLSEQVSGSAEKSPSGGSQTVDREAALSFQKTSDISRSDLQALGAVLSKIGLDISKLDTDSIVRALLLTSHDISLDSSIITDSLDAEPLLFERLETVFGLIDSVLADPRLPRDIRSAIQTLANNLNSLFTAGGTSDPAGVMTGHVIDTWEYELLSGLRFLTDGASPDAHAGVTEDMSSGLEMLLHPLSGDDFPGEAMRSIREAVARFREQVLEPGHIPAESYRPLREALDMLSARFARIAGDVAAFMSDSGAAPDGVGTVAVFFEERIRDLERRLRVFSDSNPIAHTEGTGGGLPSLGNALRMNGMGFEWRLLAWYRSGADPARLMSLVNGDLKGVLLRFLADMKHCRDRKRPTAGLAKLEHSVRSLADSITGRQLSATLNRTTEKNGVVFDVASVGGVRGKGVRIMSKDRHRRTKDRFDREDGTCSFEVETSGLGHVAVSMGVIHGSVSIVIAVEREEGIPEAGELSGDLTHALEQSGLHVSSLRIVPLREKGETIESQVEGDVSGGVDIKG